MSLMDTPICARTRLVAIRRLLRDVEMREESDCWEWSAATNSKGYPVLRFKRSIIYAHRLSHWVFHGPIPEGEQVHHRCMNPICVNPAHLVSVSPELNRAMQAAGVGDPFDDSGVPF